MAYLSLVAKYETPTTLYYSEFQSTIENHNNLIEEQLFTKRLPKPINE